MGIRDSWNTFKAAAPVGAIAVATFFVGAAEATWLNRLESYVGWTCGFALVLTVIVSQATRAPHLATDNRLRWIIYHLVTSASAAMTLAAAISMAAMLLMASAGGATDLSMTALALLRRISGKGLRMLAAAAVTTALGSIFFIFRLRLRFLYGASESIVGAAIAAQRVSSEPGDGLPSETGFYIAILTAGVYLVVRGLDNMHQAMKDDDPVWVWAWARWAALRRFTGTPAAHEATISDALRASARQRIKDS